MTHPDSTSLSSGKRFFLILFTLFSLTLIAYGNTLLSPFNYDDESVIRNEIASTGHRFFQLNPPQYRHLFYLSLALNHSWGQLNPLGYHLFNIALHFLTATTVFWIVFLTVGRGAAFNKKTAFSIAGIAVFLFLLNPVHSETVTYISGRASGLGAMFYLLSLLLFILGSLRKTGPEWLRPVYYLLSICAFGCAVFSKEIAVTLPAILILYDLFFIKGPRWSSLKSRFFFFYLPILAFAVFFILHSPSLLSVIQKWLPRFDLNYAASQLPVIAYAVKLFFFPANLTFDYDFSERFFAQGTVLIFATVLFLVLIYGVLQTAPKTLRLFSFSLLWFLITISPTNSFLPRQDLLSERNLYLPSIGLIVIAAALIHSVFFSEAGKTRLHFLGIAFLGIVFTANAALLMQRNSVYQSNIDLWEDTLVKSPGKLRALHNLSHFYLEEKNYQKAFVPLKKLAASHASPFYLSFAHNNLGNIYTQWESFAEAEKEFRKAIQTDPTIPTGHFNLASLYASHRRFREAKAEYDKAEERYTIYLWGYPKPAELAFNRAKVNVELNLFGEAEKDILHYIEKEPGSGEGRLLLAQIYSATGREELAMQTYQSVQGHSHLMAKAHNDMGILLIKGEKFAEAMAEFTQALLLNPNSLDAHFNMGTLLLRTGGDTAKASLHLQAALTLSRDAGRRESIQRQLGALKADEPG